MPIHYGLSSDTRYKQAIKHGAEGMNYDPSSGVFEVSIPRELEESFEKKMGLRPNNF